MPAASATATYPTSVVTDADIGIFTNNVYPKVTADISSGALSMVVDSVTDLSVGMFLSLHGSAGFEVVRITAIDAATKTLTIARAQDGTTAVAHTLGQKIYPAIPAKSLNQMREEIQAIENSLIGGVGSLKDVTITSASAGGTPLSLDLPAGSTSLEFLAFKNAGTKVGSMVYDSTNDQVEFRDITLTAGSGANVLLEDDRELRIGSDSDGVLKFNATSGRVEYAGVDFDLKTGALYVGSTLLFESDCDLAVSLIPNAATTLNLGSPTRPFQHAYLGDGGLAYFGTDQDVSMGYVTNASGGYYLDADGSAIIPSGVADLGAAVNAAITAGVKHIRIPASVGGWTTSISVNAAGVTLEGQGMDLTRLSFTGSTGYAIDVSAANVRIAHLEVSLATAGASGVIRISGTSLFELDNVHANANSIGVSAVLIGTGTTSQGTLIHVRAGNATTNDFHIQGGIAVTLVGCDAYGSTVGYYIRDSQTVRLLGCNATGAATSLQFNGHDAVANAVHYVSGFHAEGYTSRAVNFSGGGAPGLSYNVTIDGLWCIPSGTPTYHVYANRVRGFTLRNLQVNGATGSSADIAVDSTAASVTIEECYVGTSVATVSNLGGIAYTQRYGSTLILRDVQLSRGAADRLDLASGDSFNIVSGNLMMGTTTLFESDRDLAVSLIPNAAGALDLGSATREFRHAYFTDDGIIYLGSDQDGLLRYVSADNIVRYSGTAWDFYGDTGGDVATYVTNARNPGLGLGTTTLYFRAKDAANASLINAAGIRSGRTTAGNNEGYLAFLIKHATVGEIEALRITEGGVARLQAAPALSTATMRDAQLAFRGYYWNGSASTAVDAAITLDIVSTTPDSYFTFNRDLVPTANLSYGIGRETLAPSMYWVIRDSGYLWKSKRSTDPIDTWRLGIHSEAGEIIWGDVRTAGARMIAMAGSTISNYAEDGLEGYILETAGPSNKWTGLNFRSEVSDGNQANGEGFSWIAGRLESITGEANRHGVLLYSETYVKALLFIQGGESPTYKPDIYTFGDVILQSQTAVTNGALLDSTKLILRAKYDSDATASVTSANRDASLIHNITAGGSSPVSQLDLDIGGTTIASFYDTGGAFVRGGILGNVASKTAAYTLTDTDFLVKADATAGAFTITLPTASGRAGKEYRIKKMDSSANAVTVDGNGAETIDGSATYALTTQYDSVTLVSDGTNWVVV